MKKLSWSRGGERWKNLDELSIKTSGGIDVIVGFYEESEGEPYDTAWIETTDASNIHKNYHARRSTNGGLASYELLEINSNTEEENAVSNQGHLAPARLVSILADAHFHTPIPEDI